MPIREVVIENVRALMEARRDTTYSLADRSGLPQSTVSNILSGRHKISIEAAESIAGAYGLGGWRLMVKDIIRGEGG